jgi:hypothetical protein
MKLIFLILTVLFSASVLADCCNFEVETSYDHLTSLEKNHPHQHEDTASGQHSEATHCHCSPLGHFKLIQETKLIISPPPSSLADRILSSTRLLLSHFESQIFHPPIA